MSGCGAEKIAPAIQDMVDVLDEAIIALNQNSELWDDALDKAIDKLTAVGQEALRDDLKGLLTDGAAAVQTGVLCVLDFAGIRVREQLSALKAELLGKEPPSFKPRICQVNPDSINLSRRSAEPQLRYYGYNFDATPLPDVVIIDSKGIQELLPRTPTKVSNYELTLNVTGLDLPRDSKLMLSWNGEELSSLDIFSPDLPDCVVEPKGLQVPPIDLVPDMLLHGDREFFGNGPKITGSVQLFENDVSVMVDISMTAVEWDANSSQTTGDDTTVAGTIQVRVGEPDPGFQVLRIVTESTDSFEYIDSPQGSDSINRGGGLVTKYQFVGDTPGADAGVATKVTVHLGLVKIEQIQVANCRPV